MSALEQWLPAAVFIFTLTSLILLLLPASYGRDLDVSSAGNKRSVRVQILVLGDIGRSPRMQYHALSIARHGGFVDLIGYRESELHPHITSSSRITVRPIPPISNLFKTKNKRLFLIFGPLKVLFQIWSLWLILGYKTRPAKWMLVQNPPSIPSLFVAQVICFIRNTRLIVDWHNFGHSILALKLGHNHPLVQTMRFYEQTLSRSAAAHFTVTDAMGRVLKQDYGITGPIISLHDRPTSDFCLLNEAQRLRFLRRLEETAPYIDEIEKGKLKLLVSSTSWTPDEDFSLLLEALVKYSGLAMHSHPHLPRIIVIITGKGPQKAEFLTKIAMLEAEDKLEMVVIKTAWLTIEDYASLLGAADLGISLHMSSSGVDLPMKVVDMFGAGLPVVGWSRYTSWPELVTEGVNGRGFGSVADLQAVLVDLFGGDKSKMQVLKAGAVREGERKWDDEWDSVAGKLFELC